ncbi:MAG: 3-phosphoshikimate 1-carboxyvinyltransferase [Clostridia bacterium]
MSNVIYKKAVKGGSITLPPSKSVAHRAMICAALAQGNCTVFNIDSSNDMLATMNFIKAMGKDFNYDPKTKVLKISSGTTSQITSVDCIESGSTLRFIIPIMAALGINTTFTGSGRLPKRPIGVYTEILKGVNTKGVGLPFCINGQLQSGEFKLRGDISSQFITGLLFALPLLKGDSKIILTTELQSESYVDITLDVMKSFGVTATRTDYGYKVKGNQTYKTVNYTVEGDWSQAAFFIAMGAFSKNPIKLKGLKLDSKQGDKKCTEVFGNMNIKVNFADDELIINKGELKAITVNVGDIPDMVPALACVMALANGTSEITNAKRLRIKESDRLSAISNALNSLGANVTELEDGLIIKGTNKLIGGFVDGCNDHRIVMAMACLRENCLNNIEVTDSHSINKSYPDFYKDYIKLGGELNGIDMG